MRKQSAESKAVCIDHCIKQFLPPVDREDIAFIACTLHRLNVRLSYLSVSINVNEAEELKLILKTMCHHIERSVNERLETRLSDFVQECEKTSKSFFEEYSRMQKNINSTPFNTKNLIKSKFFDRIKECFDLAWEITDCSVTVKVKNS